MNLFPRRMPAQTWGTPRLDSLTFSVTALRVNGKAMTVSIFRQIPLKSITNEDGEAIELVEPWGIVHHEHKHKNCWLLFIHEGKLFRTSLETSQSTSSQYELKRALAAINEARTKSHYLLKSRDPEEQKKERLQLEEDANLALEAASRMVEIEERRVAVHQYASTFPQLYIGA